MTAWSPLEATGFLLSRELFGMRLGLERMQALTNALDSPQDRFDSIHVVGTNGKSSTSRFAAAILAERGVRSGAYVSPHLTGFNERVLMPRDGAPQPVAPEAFARAVQRVAEVAIEVEASLPDGEVLTQFELVTAAAFTIFADAGVEAVAVEAGLGGRFDATNVLPGGKVVLLTSVGLDHTRWLGEDVRSISIEKLAVVAPGDRLAVAELLPPEVLPEVEVAAARSGNPVRRASGDHLDGIPLLADAPFQRRNLALAALGVEILLGSADGGAVARAAAATSVPGRFQAIGDEPLTLIDSAHNVEGAVALAESLGKLKPPSPIVLVVGMLDDKDAAGFIAAIIDSVDVIVATRPLNPRALDAGRLGSIAAEAGGVRTEVVPDHRDALAAARSIASEEGGSVLVAGSVHLIGDVISPPDERIVTAL